MGDHVIVTVTAEKLMQTPSSITENHVAISIEELNATLEADKEEKPVNEETEEEKNNEESEERGECRYCQEEDLVSNLESPCNCTGTMKYIHKSCMDKWYNAKGYCILCEICKKAYPDNYYPLPEIISSDDEDNDDAINEISEEPEPWTIPGTNTQIHSPMVVARTATNSLISSMNKDFNWRRPTFGMILGMALLIFVAVLVIKDAIDCVPPKEEKLNRFLYFTVVTLTVPIYIMSWVFRCQAYRKELMREREIEMERDRSV